MATSTETLPVQLDEQVPSSSNAAPAPSTYTLPDYILRAINGTMTVEEKNTNYDASLHS